MSRFTFLLLGLYLLQGATWAQTPEDHFEKKVRPLLLERCVKCHGPETSRSSLRLDSYEGAIKGGKRGAALVPNAPAESLLLKVVRRQGDLKMPPDGPLSTREISDLELWIKQGAIYPKSNKIVRGTAEHWSFQPIKQHSVPKVNNSAWVRNPIDAFILSKLETAGIAPSKQADKRTLIRRVSFDLTGLPPTLSESALYLADNSANAYENMVNRYLASPTYGERWGRHWLDVARYADSNGLDENVAHGNAWRYRDYVVESFNKNVPYNQFISEQIAGDLLPYKSDSEKHAHLIATGYLTLGPKVLAEVDKQKMEMDIIDEQIDTMGKTFLGLTLGCARCHDHKFDPILTGDYYSLAGVFKSTKTMESLVTIAKWNENPLANEKETAQLKEYTAKVAESKKKADDFLEEQRKALASEKKLTPKEIEALLKDEPKASLKKLRDATAALEKTAPELPSAMGVTEGKVTDVAIHIRGNTDRLGKVMPRAVPVVLAKANAPAFSEKSSGRLELANWIASPSNPLTSRVMVNRVWRWHFGRGIVPTPDNFGLLGSNPTHPELLDWLANQFIQSNWSIKDLHKTIMFSNTYKQASTLIPASDEKDSSCNLYWRFVPKRLEGEVLRDSLLQVSDQLDKTMGGSLLQVKNRAFFFDHTSKDMTKYDSNRRSLYLPVVRNNLFVVFSLFDSTDAAVPNGDRANTTIAPQALFFLNSKLVLDTAELLAQKAIQKAPTAEAQVLYLYENILGRTPTLDEANRAKDFLLQALKLSENNPVKAMAALAQILVSSNEFVTLR
jgi:Protein of unknown function (DUF1549)/Protein of unknown function (DUF1553)/Planctomycete cytochrome C